MSSWLPLAGCLASSWLHSYHTHSTTPILWATKCQPFFFLSNHVSIQISLCRHKTQSSRSFCRLCDGLTGAPVLGVSLLYTNPGGHSRNPLRGGSQKGLLHLFFPPLCGWALFWLCYRHVHGPQIQAFPRTEKDPVFVLQPFQPYAQPSDLQFEEHRGKSCLKKCSLETEITVRLLKNLPCHAR